jgi:capsular polysaccharide export protein
MMEQKSILIVTDRSNYFSFLGKELEKFYNVYYIAVWKKDEILLKEKDIPYTPRDDLLKSSIPAPTNRILNDEEMKKALSCDLQYDALYNNGNLQDSIFIEGLNYASEIAKIMQSNKIDLVIVQNDSWNYASIPIAVARKNNIKTLIFEDGFFRPDTIVLDGKGVNKNNSCPREKTYYENITINKGKYDTFIQKENIKGSGPLVDLFSGVKLSNVTGKLFNFFRHPRKILRVIPLTVNLIGFLNAKRDFILLPLQVRSDSQIICHSPLKDMEDFVDICLTSIERYNRKCKKHLSVVIKEHPKDPQMDLLRRTRKKHKNVKNYYLTKANTRKLIEKCTAIITINSTIGIEGLLYYKPVITLGQAFYNIESIVHHCADPAKLDNVINIAINAPTDRKLTDSFLYNLKFDYQVDGDLNNPDTDNIKPVIKRIRDTLDHEI